MDNYFNNTAIVRLMIRWRKHLAIIVFLAIVLGAVLSGPFFITPLYRSDAIVYPTNLQSYSDESETEQLLQWFNSRSIMDSMVVKFDLPKRYKIDKDYKHYHTLIQTFYNKRIRIKKTPYEAVQIEVIDHDPLVASQMADSIIALVNKVILTNHRVKYEEVLTAQEYRLSRKEAEIDSVAMKLYDLRVNYGIIDYPNQSREVARGFLRTVDGNNSANINTREVMRLKDNIEEKGGEWVKYNDRFYKLIVEYGEVKTGYDWAYLNANKYITFTTVVSKPYPSDMKFFPVRWVVVALSALGAFLVAMFVIFMLENRHIIASIQQED